MSHHFHVVIVFGVVAFYGGYLPIHHEEFGMKSTEKWLVKIRHLKVYMWYLLWFGKLNRFSVLFSLNVAILGDSIPAYPEYTSGLTC